MRYLNSKNHTEAAEYKGEDWRGRTVGLWTILAFHSCTAKGSTRNYETRWLDRRGCGAEVPVSKSNLISNQSLGCRNRLARRGQESSSWKGLGTVPGRKWSRMRAGARTRNLEVSVDFSYVCSILEKQEFKCALTGRTLDPAVDGSIDRIDSTKGYVEGNIQWLHKHVNRAKSDLSEDAFLELCREVVAHRDLQEESNDECAGGYCPIK